MGPCASKKKFQIEPHYPQEKQLEEKQLKEEIEDQLVAFKKKKKIRKKNLLRIWM